MDTDQIIDDNNDEDVTSININHHDNHTTDIRDISITQTNGHVPGSQHTTKKSGTAESPAGGLPSEGQSDAAPQRETWSNKMDFILSAVGYAVGFGNIWRFPHLCYINGGGAFLIPYFIMMLFLGLPLFYLELALGQYASLGPISVWKFCPIFKGLGYSMLGINILVSIYYNVILALSIFYFFASFTKELPWTHCGYWWNRNCAENKYIASLCNQTTDTEMSFNFTTNITCNLTNPEPVRSPSDEYFQFYVFGITDDTDIEDIGQVRWQLTLCNLLGWVIIYLCIVKGIQASGKVVYFTATFPYVVLFILLIRGVTLPGAGEGIRYYLTPDFERLAHVKVWKDAATQILFSLGPGFGNLLTLGSYNKFNNKVHRDAVTVTLINCATSIFAGFVIFSVLGFMAQARNVSVDLVVDKGPGLAFIAYPEALAMMPGAPFWSICFFFMLVTLGLDTQFVGVECIITGLMDEFPLVSRWKKTTMLIICTVLYLGALPCVTQGGMYVIELIDKFTTSFPLLFVTMLECIVISYVYGINRFCSDIETMIGSRPNYFWIACWTFISPVILFFILIFACVEYSGIDYIDYHYPVWTEWVGWIMASTLMALVPGWMIVKLCQAIGSCQNCMWVVRGPASIKMLNLRDLFRPAPSWGPALAENRSMPNITSQEVVAPPPVPESLVSFHEDQCFIMATPSYSTTEPNFSHI